MNERMFNIDTKIHLKTQIHISNNSQAQHFFKTRKAVLNNFKV